MFWIYGGGFRGGSIFSDMYNGKSLASYDVVYVAVDYRMGSLGFIYGGDDDMAPGNLGLLDQIEGLKWVCIAAMLHFLKYSYLKCLS